MVCGTINGNGLLACFLVVKGLLASRRKIIGCLLRRFCIAIGRASRGAICRTGFLLTPGQAYDLVGADHFPPTIEADIVIADKASDAGERVIGPLTAAGRRPSFGPKRTGGTSATMIANSTRNAT